MWNDQFLYMTNMQTYKMMIKDFYIIFIDMCIPSNFFQITNTTPIIMLYWSNCIHYKSCHKTNSHIQIIWTWTKSNSLCMVIIEVIIVSPWTITSFWALLFYFVSCTIGHESFCLNKISMYLIWCKHL